MKGCIRGFSSIIGAAFIWVSAAVADVTAVAPVPPAVTGTNATSCSAYDSNPKNSCAARWANVSTMSGCSAMITKIAGQIPNLSATEKPNVESAVNRFLEKYKSAICLGKPVRACFNRIDRRVSTVISSDAAPDGRAFMRIVSGKAGGLTSPITTAVSNVNAMATVANSNFFIKPLTDEKDLTIYNAYCPTGSESAVNLSTPQNVQNFLIGKNPPVKFGKYYVNYSDNVLKPSFDYAGLKQQGLSVWYDEVKLDEDCVATGKVEFVGNQFNTVNQSSPIFTKFKECVDQKIASGFKLTSINISASSSRLNNTQDAADQFCRKGFYALAKARGEAVKNTLTTVLGNSIASATVTVDPSGVNSDGSSGPCPYRCKDPLSSTCEEELDPARNYSNLQDARDKLKEFQYVRIGAKLKGTSVTPGGSDGKWEIQTIRECYDLNIACGNTDVSCGSAPPVCCTMDQRCCAAYQGTKCCNWIMEGGQRKLSCVK